MNSERDIINSIYDDPHFFEKYRSLHLTENIYGGFFKIDEEHKLHPDIRGKNVLDLGCGFGDYLRYAKDRGAGRCVGLDNSRRMIKEACRLDTSGSIAFMPVDIGDFSTDHTYDLCVSSLALHYLDAVASTFACVFRELAYGGKFVFSVEHPIASAAAIGWQESVTERRWGVEGYLNEGPREFSWFGQDAMKFHRPISSWFRALTHAGFLVTDVCEPPLNRRMQDLRQGLGIDSDRPAFIVFSAVKPVELIRS